MTRIFRSTLGITLLLTILSGAIGVHSQDIQTAFKLTRAERFEDASSAFKALLQNNMNDGDIYY